MHVVWSTQRLFLKSQNIYHYTLEIQPHPDQFTNYKTVQYSDVLKATYYLLVF